MPPLRVAVVIPTADIAQHSAFQADCLLRAWQADADVEASAVSFPGVSGWQWPRVVKDLAGVDVVHVITASAASFLPLTVPLALARGLGRPTILSYDDDQGTGDVRHAPIVRRALTLATTRVVPSTVMVETLDRVGIGATMIPHLVEPETFRFRERDPLRPRLLSVGNFEARDNVAATIRAFEIVQRHWPGATLMLVGSGPQEENLRALAADLGVRDVMFMAPRQPRDLAAVYADHDIFVQSANVDNGPTSILRAFASGLPVVSTAAGAVPAILTHGVHGLLASLADYETLGHHMLRLLASPDYARRLARAAHATCDACSWPRVREQWLRVYNSAASSRRQPQRSALARLIFASFPWAATGLPIGAEPADRASAQRRTS